jgi:hypothetical protein
MYDTVITPHSTSIAHADHMNGGLTLSAGAAAMFQQNEASKLAQGQLAIPVKIETGSKNIDDNLETPIFIHKEQRAATEDTMNVEESSLITPSLASTSAADANNIKNSLSSAKTFEEKVGACKIYIYV